jgi:hypothetical protein
MTYTDLADQMQAFFASQKRKRGRRSLGTRDPNLDRPLRQAARLVVHGTAKSGRAALIQVLGEDNAGLDDHYQRWTERKPALRAAAEYAKDMEDKDPEQREIESFDRVNDDEIGTYALINQNSTDWAKAGSAGWNSVRGFGHGEVLIRRDLLGESLLVAPRKRMVHQQEG